MTSENFTFTAGNETLAATIDWNAAKTAPTVLSLHGGGESAKTRAAPLTQSLALCGLSCLRFDHSGQGESTGELKLSSLAKRTDEALAAIDRFADKTKPLTVIGTSMGGPIALELTKHVKVKTLILFCPALYAKDAFTVPFDERLTEILRRENSYLDTDLSILHNFTGGFLHIIGEKDTVIPQGVTDLYERSVLQADPSDFIQIENAPHHVHGFLRDNPPVMQAVVNMMLDFISA